MFEKKVLIVDDEKALVDLLEARLSPRYAVVKAYDGREGLNKAITEQPDLILSDLLMPRMDGYELVRSLKNHLETQDIPVVVITAIEDTSSIYRAQSLGIADYVIKPLHLEEFPELVRKYAQ